MPKIAAVATADPPYTITQAQTKAFARSLFSEDFRDIDRLLGVFDHTLIEQRRFCVPADWFEHAQSFKDKNDLYRKHAKELGARAARKALRQAGIQAADIDAILFVSSTGLSTPSLDVGIAAEIGLREDIHRLPLWGLGCAGGVSGLARAAELTTADPKAVVLLIAVELCGLTFVHGDRSKSNLVGAALFADGAAAVIVAGDNRERDNGRPFTGPAIVGSQSQLWPDSEDIMGWEVTDAGLSVIFSRDIPMIVRREIAGQVSRLLDRHRVARHELARFVAHPGGVKVLAAYQEALSLPDNWLDEARAVLRKHGNMSSPTVLYVLERTLREPPEEGYGVVVALGPGFSCDQVLIRF